MTPEDLRVCPFDPNHRIPTKRFQYHLASCRKKHPEMTKKMASCKYNACHIIPCKKLKEHEATCVDRIAIEDELFDFPKIVSTLSEPKDKLSNAANQIPDPDGWNVDNTQLFPPFVLKAFAPKMLVCERYLKV
ncbi:PREDICTED: gametocyte-specific factor 1-like [Elephantulus edwardii]|uniref:gametocyte-specific factor 1-like n=1 Tax=Elephantulus edwardii TaxID=28737 RepID=UPI0003F0CE07|nr:PREDICTED: gametocyte-specific factor 1-like [Elephantulus edwardii]